MDSGEHFNFKNAILGFNLLFKDNFDLRTPSRQPKSLIYLAPKNKMFCFRCKLFGNSLSALRYDEICAWKNASVRLYDHEKSKGFYYLL